MTGPYWDPFDENLDQEAHSVWKRLRDEAPVYWNEKYQFYAVSRYDDVHAVVRDPQTFSSAYGTVLEVMSDDPFPLPGMLIFMDPPNHTQLRKLASGAFTPRRMAHLEARVAHVCKELLDPLAGEATFDYLGMFGDLLPPTMILSLLGFPDGYADQWRARMTEGYTDRAQKNSVENSTVNFIYDMQHEDSVFAFLPELCRDRRNEPQEDLISVLVQSEMVDGHDTRPLSDVEISTFVHMLAVAGSDTVAKTLGWMAVLLARNPDQRDALNRDRSLIPQAVEEVLRYESPTPMNGRRVTTDVEMQGTRIPAGANLIMINGSADRDERHFEDPDRFDVRRNIDRHFAFGYGAHFCLGQALARVESRVALAETLARWSDWDVDETGLEWFPRNTSVIRGFTKVPMVVR